MSNKTLSILLFLIFISLFAFILIDRSNINALHDKYTLVESEHEVIGTIQSIKKRNGVCFISIKSGHYALRSSENRDYKNEFLYDNLFVGDSILKQANIDTVWVINAARRVYFVNGRIIP